MTDHPQQRFRRARGKKAPWWELPALVVVAVVVAVLIKTFLIQPFFIPSASMESTLHGCEQCSGDRIVVDKPIYHLRAPHPGDIVVFRLPPTWANDFADTTKVTGSANPVIGALRWAGRLVGVIPPNEEDLVKRVIAIGGQTIKGDADGTIHISNTGPAGPYRTLDENPYLNTDHAAPGTAIQQPFGPVTIPADRLWVMGDHRTDSQDSRYHCVAGRHSNILPTGATCDPIASTVPDSLVIGKATLIAWPIGRWTTLGTPPTFSARNDPLP